MRNRKINGIGSYETPHLCIGRVGDYSILPNYPYRREEKPEEIETDIKTRTYYEISEEKQTKLDAKDIVLITLATIIIIGLAIVTACLCKREQLKNIWTNTNEQDDIDETGPPKRKMETPQVAQNFENFEKASVKSPSKSILRKPSLPPRTNIPESARSRNRAKSISEESVGSFAKGRDETGIRDYSNQQFHSLRRPARQQTNSRRPGAQEAQQRLDEMELTNLHRARTFEANLNESLSDPGVFDNANPHRGYRSARNPGDGLYPNITQ